MPDGLLYGVDMSFTSTLFTLGTGFMLVAGRMFEITAAESISISPGSGYARVYVAIDTGATATENSFDQVSFGVDYAANLDSFAELTQGEININQGAAVYQAEVAVLTINSSGVTGIERQMELVSPGAGTGAFAAIAVTYPAGSTVTVTDGKITYTAPNTNGAALFIIPYAATWIVTATNGTDTASETVEITTEGQSVSVELSYELWLYKNGDECVDVTGGWIAENSPVFDSGYASLSVTPVINKTESYMEASITTSGNSHSGSIKPANPINRRDKKILRGVIDWSATVNGQAGGGVIVYVAESNVAYAKNAPCTLQFGFKSSNSSANDVPIEIDISALTATEIYLGFCLTNVHNSEKCMVRIKGLKLA